MGKNQKSITEQSITEQDIAELGIAERVTKMEQYLDASADALNKLEAALETYEAAEEKYYALEQYYGSVLWMNDYEEDEAGKLPADLKRGVLSEDTVYDLITQHRDIMRRMQRAVLRSLEV